MITDKFIFRFVAGISVFVFLVVLILNRKLIPPPAHLPSFVHLLPKLNATLNGTCSVLLLTSLFFIMRRKVTIHKWLNITTFCLSSLFLISYILFHYMAPETIYGDLNGDGVLDATERAAVGGGIRTIYLIILISHIVLAAAVLPLILLSFYRGLQMQVEKHRKLVAWSFPIWLYVTVTGVIVYLMISPYYHF
jgi:putative membrane protein